MLGFEVQFPHQSSFCQKRPAIYKQSGRSQDTQARGQRFARLDRAGNAAASEDDRSEQSELNAPGLTIGNAITAQSVLYMARSKLLAGPYCR